MTDLDRINELAKELNTSTTDWLDAWTKATERLATEGDIVNFIGMASEKRQMAQELNQLLTKLMMEKI